MLDPIALKSGRDMQPTERIERAEAPPSPRPSPAAPVLAHAAVLLVRALAIAILATPVVIALVLLLR
jgi:hypothetical protein